MYSCTLSLTLELVGDGWPMPHSGCIIPGKETWYPLCRRLGGSHGQFGLVWKFSPPLGFNRCTIQPVASRFTDYTILAHSCLQLEGKFFCPEDGGSRFLWCDGQLLPGCVESRGGRQQSIYDKLLFAENICTIE